MKYQGKALYKGREVEFSWHNGEFDCSDDAAAEAIIEESSEWLGRTLVLASGERVSGDLLDHPAGFACVAGQVLQDFEWDYVPDPPVPEGAVT